MRELTRQRIEWLISSNDGDLLPEALQEPGKSVRQLMRGTLRELLDEIARLEQRLHIMIDETDRLEQRLHIMRHEIK